MPQGQIVRLAPLDPEHLDKAREWANDPELKEGLLRVLPVNRPTHERWYEELAGNPAKMVMAIHWLADGAHIGNVGLYHIDPLHRRAEFWIVIGERRYAGQGAGTEAARLMCRLAFDQLNLNRLYLHVALNNAPAIRIYEKCGFIAEGILRQHFFIEGRYRDVTVMALLKHKYEQKRSEKAESI